MKKKIILSPNYSEKTRFKRKIKFVIFHYTGMQSEIESLRRLLDPKSNVSCHFLINKKGEILQMVKENNVAWHAGKSKWKNFNNLNLNSIGIELVNRGHNLGYENFPPKQINSLIKLCKYLKKKYKIKAQDFLGHSDVAPLRKIDPGEKFPWKRLSKLDIGKWYKDLKNLSNENRKKSINVFFLNLHKIGYRYFNLKKRVHKKDKLIIKAFQQRYNPLEVTGTVDKKTLKISRFLASC